MLNEIARLLGFGVMVVAICCVILVIITGMQNLIDEIKWRIRRKSIPGILHKHHLNVVIISRWGEPSFSVEITDEKNVHLYHDNCKWKDRNKVIYRLLKGYLEELGNGCRSNFAYVDEATFSKHMNPPEESTSTDKEEK